jgi:hypothetical protein
MSNLNVLNNLFGVPVYVTKISAESYNKKEIVDNIEDNYKIDPNRNKWKNQGSYLHHSINDWENKNFKSVNFSHLFSIYEKKITEFFLLFQSKKNFQYNWKIANYTCMGKGQSMAKHMHSECDFSAVHYIKFDPKKHFPTKYYSPLIWGEFIDAHLAVNDLKDPLDLDDVSNSWLSGAWSFNINEDDFVISPALLSHSVPVSTSDDLRMTIVLNISVTKEK